MTLASSVDRLDYSTAGLFICFSTLHIVGSFYLNFLRLLQYYKKYYASTTLYYASTTTYYSVLQSTTTSYSSTTLYYKVLLQYYSVLQSTTPVLQSTTPVLLCTTPVLQRTTPVLLLKRHLQCAVQQESPSNFTKYCACHAE